ncbi:type II toxin-antitoxin system RelE/ParE family toxin [Candidatus Thiosymbion oneisti]|uniref:type II toxin-antitoxin system RelE/ParE family toxin n=1 Tax=Candidatus Thiosymbion oneisti TaxID=589554 RepID=UPI000A512741|nr:type II toxin-antitoxin system RelE/ParE family toxin [Candidatus Thiosymbion oneisti]
MIVSFGNQATSDLYHSISSARVRQLPSQLIASALYKLDVLNAVQSLDDLRSPPGNRLEALKGDFKGFHSIRVNAQWRIVFRWQDSNAHEVRIIDYH